MTSGRTASVKDAVYFPSDSLIEFKLDTVNGSYTENYIVQGKILNTDGQEIAVYVENCGVVCEKNSETDSVSVVSVTYEKDGEPIYSLKGENNFTVNIKIVNSTGNNLYGLTASVLCETETFISESFDMESYSFKTISVDVIGIDIESNSNLKISLN